MNTQPPFGDALDLQQDLEQLPAPLELDEPENEATLNYGGWSWSPLLSHELEAICDALHHDEIPMEWRQTRDRVQARYELELRELSRTLLLLNESHELCGLISVTPYPSRIGWWQTATHLHPAIWGKGIPHLAKSLQWHLAMDALKGNALCSSVNPINGRSRRSLAKTYPTGLTLEWAWEPWHPRWGLLYQLPGTPNGAPDLTERQVRWVKHHMKLTKDFDPTIAWDWEEQEALLPAPEEIIDPYGHL